MNEMPRITPELVEAIREVLGSNAQPSTEDRRIARRDARKVMRSYLRKHNFLPSTEVTQGTLEVNGQQVGTIRDFTFSFRNKTYSKPGE